jgi:hypothetical protein
MKSGKISRVNLDQHLNVDSSVSNFKNCQITAFAMHSSMLTTLSIGIMKVGNAITNQLVVLSQFSKFLQILISILY